MFYQVTDKYRACLSKPKVKPSWSLLGESGTLPSPASTIGSLSQYPSMQHMSAVSAGSVQLKRDVDGRFILPMSNCTIINLDPLQKSDRSETAL